MENLILEKTERAEVVIYQPEETTRLEVKVENDTVWLNRHQLAELFGRDIKTIGKHINNALNEELEGLAVVAKFATTATDGKQYIVDYYNLEMISSIGYRVKSQRGIHFRRWANTVLKEYLLQGYAIRNKLESVEEQIKYHQQLLDEHEKKIEFFIRTSIPPVEGIFCDGQIFDAYVFISGLIKSATQRIILIDNYIDEGVLLMLSKRSAGVSAEIRTRNPSNTLLLDIEKHNKQYAPINITICSNIHDRFLIVDNSTYHIGAPLKDLGKKLFAFSRINMNIEHLLIP